METGFSLSLLNKFLERTIMEKKKFLDERSGSEFQFSFMLLCARRSMFVYIEYIFKVLMYTILFRSLTILLTLECLFTGCLFSSVM